MAVENPRLLPTKRLLDFGQGFYLTSNLEQARKWAFRTRAIREAGIPTISAFEFDNNILKQLDVLIFNFPDKDWLRYVAANRTGQVTKLYDIVLGPVANDQTIRTVNDFLNGYLSEEIAIQLLLPQKLKDQYAFKTDNALRHLYYKETIE